MEWKEINTLEDLENAIKASYEKPVALFKHSTRCSVSYMAKKNVEYDWDLDIDAYFLDLIEHRDISNQIAQQLSVHHQSPQMILIKDGEAVYNASHGRINVDSLKNYL